MTTPPEMVMREIDAEEIRLMDGCSAAFEAVVEMLLKDTPADEEIIIGALGLTATRMMFRKSVGAEQCMQEANVFARVSLRMMAELVSGGDAHQGMQ